MLSHSTPPYTGYIYHVYCQHSMVASLSSIPSPDHLDNDRIRLPPCIPWWLANCSTDYHTLSPANWKPGAHSIYFHHQNLCTNDLAPSSKLHHGQMFTNLSPISNRSNGMASLPMWLCEISNSPIVTNIIKDSYVSRICKGYITCVALDIITHQSWHGL